MKTTCQHWLAALLLVGLGFGQMSCDNRQQASSAAATVNEKAPKLTFKDAGVHDFGTITEGDTVEHTFTFTNTGAFPLIINNITASCGCTTPEWPREPIAPGAESTIRVRFDSRGRQGEQRKTVTVYANTDPSMTDLEFRVMVTPKNAAVKTS